MTTPTVSLVDVSTYLPENRVSAEYYANFAGTDELREDLMFRAPEYRHHVDKDKSTFHECGNLFAAINDGQLTKGDVVMMAGFAHAGDFAGTGAVRWGGRTK